MGAGYDAIQQIAGRSIPDEQKTLEIRRLKAVEHRNVIEALSLPHLVALSRNRTVSIDALRAVPDDDYLEVVISWTKNGAKQPFSNPWRIVNPPLLVPDPAGEVELVGQTAEGKEERRKLREDPLAALIALMDRKLR